MITDKKDLSNQLESLLKRFQETENKNEKTIQRIRENHEIEKKNLVENVNKQEKIKRE